MRRPGSSATSSSRRPECWRRCDPRCTRTRSNSAKRRRTGAIRGIRITTPTLWRCHPCNFDVCPKCWEGATRPRRRHSTRTRPLRTGAAGAAARRRRPGPRQGPGPGPRRRAPGPGAGRGRDYELGHRARGGEAHAAVLVARGDGAGLRRRVGRREPGAAVISRQDHRRRLRAGSEPLPEDAQSSISFSRWARRRRRPCRRSASRSLAGALHAR